MKNYNIFDDADDFLFGLSIENPDGVLTEMLRAALEAEYLTSNWVDEKELADNLVQELFDYGYHTELLKKQLPDGESICIWDL